MNALKDIDKFINLEIATRKESQKIWGNKHQFTKIHDRRIGELKNIKHYLWAYQTKLSIIIDHCIENGVTLYMTSAKLHKMFDDIRSIAEDW